MATDGERLAVLEERVSAVRAEVRTLQTARREHLRRLEVVERRQESEDAVAEAIARAASERFSHEARRERLVIALAGLALTGLNVAVAMWG